MDHDPFGEGHVLILPKKHAEELEELNEKTSAAIFRAAGLLSKAIRRLYLPDGITICQNGGIFSELNHFHLHVVPRKLHQPFSDFYADDSTLDNEELKKKLALTHIKLSSAVKQIQKEEKNESILDSFP